MVDMRLIAGLGTMKMDFDFVEIRIQAKITTDISIAQKFQCASGKIYCAIITIIGIRLPVIRFL
jgi:hypothetical protein